ncbi:hypothetical protein GCM10010910_10590 [Microbacterium nanhaiense]|uniref:Uncharacterized protein n=1 Tax=Microbacterium nanhaiense TaxID=1301026 RepID=A0ABQ2N3N8_9MICO|nr:hypothetical protein [Microbacterium nanhaiense]GGO61838.1 hypothetical protein GCM10010910_10590 [Microbacterium nanhaiense]
MAEFPWQKAGDDDAPRFPWQKPEDEADDEARVESSMPWLRPGDDDRAALAEDPAPASTPAASTPPARAPEASAGHADAGDSAPSEPAPSEPAPAEPAHTEPVHAEPAHTDEIPPEAAEPDAAEASEPPLTEQARPERTRTEETARIRPDTPATVRSDAGGDTAAGAGPATEATSAGEVPPSTFTPPWRPDASRPDASRPHSKKPRPTPRAVTDPAPGPGPAPKRGRAAKIAGASTLAAVAGAIVLGIGAALFASGSGSPDAVETSPTPTVVPLAADEIAMDAAGAFVDAIASGNAPAALAMLGAAESTLTSEDTWRTMVENYPITDVAVVNLGDGSWQTQPIDVSYTMNGESVSFMLSVEVDVTEPENTVIDFDLPTLEITDGFEGFDITLNGVALPESGAASYEVLPGAYTVGTTTEYFRIEPAPVIASSSMAFLYPYEHEPTLTEDGVAKFREAVRASAEACVGSTTLDAGCGLSVTGGLEGGGSLVDGTVERSLSDEQWALIDAMVPSASSFDGAKVQEGEFVGDVTFYADWQQNGYSGRDEIHGGPWLYRPHVDFSDPALPVTWE